VGVQWQSWQQWPGWPLTAGTDAAGSRKDARENQAMPNAMTTLPAVTR